MYSEGLAAFMQIIRVKNLVMIALTQFFVRLFIIDPVFFNYKIEHALSGIEFYIFVTATLCIAAAGYIINDYFDVGMDRVNKPMRVTIGEYFSRQQAFRLHLIFNIIGVALGIFSAWLAGNVRLGFIFPVIAGILWFYAKTYKKVFLLGNILVGLVTAAVPLVVAYSETKLFTVSNVVTIEAGKEIMRFTVGYAIFAFLATLIREIIKDAEDIEGDREYGCQTLPIVLGLKTTKVIIASLTLMMIGLLFIAQQYFFRDNLLMEVSYILIALQLPAAGMLFYLVPATTQDDFARLSKWMKVLMALGVASMAVFYFL